MPDLPDIPIPEPVPMRSLNVLVVDDEPTSREILAASLKRAGHAVSDTASGGEALARMAESDPDVVFCDVSMPVMDGIELVRRARTAGSEAAFIMMTAYSSVDTAVEAMKAGAFAGAFGASRPHPAASAMHATAAARPMRRRNAVGRAMAGAGRWRGDPARGAHGRTAATSAARVLPQPPVFVEPRRRVSARPPRRRQ